MPFTAWTGRSGLACIPEVFLAWKLDDVARIHTDLFGQHVVGLVIILPQRRPQSIPVQAVHAVLFRAGQQIPRQVDRTFLEVVTEGEVSVHLEERAVARGASNVVNVVGADTLLHRCDARPRRRFNAGDIRNERHHPRDREQNRWIGRNQGN